MKIAIVGSKGVPGRHGVEIVIESLLPHLFNLGYEITVYGYDSYTSPMHDYHGARIKTVRGFPSKNIEMLSHMVQASLDTRYQNYDIVHIHNTDPCLLSWLPKAKKGIIATSHGQAYLRNKWSLPAKLLSRIAERFFIWFPKLITSVSLPLSVFYRKKYNRPVEYVPNGIVVRNCPDPEILEKWQLRSRSYLFCSAGRIERTKGIHTLLKAYEMLNTNLRLIIAGGGKGTDEKYFFNLTQNIPTGARFIGFLSGDELFTLYAHAKIFVFPSEYEAMSMALLEGLSFGTPTVYSNTPENTAVASGLAFPFKVSNADSLERTLDFVINHYDRALDKGSQAASHVRRHHDWANIAVQYSNLYQRL